MVGYVVPCFLDVLFVDDVCGASWFTDRFPLLVDDSLLRTENWLLVSMFVGVLIEDDFGVAAFRGVVHLLMSLTLLVISVDTGLVASVWNFGNGDILCDSRHFRRCSRSLL